MQNETLEGMLKCSTPNISLEWWRSSNPVWCPIGRKEISLVSIDINDLHLAGSIRQRWSSCTRSSYGISIHLTCSSQHKVLRYIFDWSWHPLDFRWFTARLSVDFFFIFSSLLFQNYQNILWSTNRRSANFTAYKVTDTLGLRWREEVGRIKMDKFRVKTSQVRIGKGKSY